ncbi:hypothetical protein H6G20_09795 [Desertifilum sp. FACHB-1129]|uniref:LSDAT prokaryote domain-containing protein n=1 Tax=Desertifilum tharense IPPAS B-1220 TaxID=1781255 RepID=A0A1E5QL36_9CYAN|nr:MULTISPECIES: hypothetical protein [Desertifilum]MBD2311950.1 hypothetical protein [Desertifilum sp. FACHB-1129]MBD2322402.1 hypothetical protein [Desertifilum sp. FACHB-866]OEJ75350.1 hypothetical protein BH720_10160 [Desertifilum tharense IPPAS B-1220]
MKTSTKLAFPQGQTAIAQAVDEIARLPETLNELGFKQPHPTLVLIGGASGLTPNDAEKLQTLFQDAICPLAEASGWIVIDGGTDAGIMGLMGQAYRQMNCTFSLLGIVVQNKAILPATEQGAGADAAQLEPHHTHFLLVPGCQWGDESAWIAQAATLLAQHQGSVTLAINGGEITLKQDIPNSLKHQRPVVVLAGTGRTADRVASVADGQTQDAEIQPLVDSGLIISIDWRKQPEALKQVLQKFLMP